MATKRRADMVSIASLSKSIDTAVALAAKRHDAVFEKDNVILNWEILGRILRKMNLEGGQTRLDLAATVVKNLSKVKGQPVVTKIGKDIFVGFIERSGRTFNF